MMVSTLQFAKKFNLEHLKNYPGIYTVQSECVRGMAYGVSDGKFAIIRSSGVTFCPFHEAPILAAQQTPEMQEEILGIYEDILDLRRMNIKVG